MCLRSLAGFLLLVCASSAALGQSPALDHPDEAVVVEKFHTVVRWENDGTGWREQTARIRMLTAGGVQHFGQLAFGYSSHTEEMQVIYVRVVKPDGSVVTASEDAVQDVPDPVVRQAPVYSDFRQKHITVPGLRPGDTLEFKLRINVHTPLTPGHFWFDHQFEENLIVLEEVLEADVPQGRTLTVKTRDKDEPVVREEQGRRIYRWTSSRTKRESEEERKEKARKAPRYPPPPPVQLTTFAGWDEVARWYDGLQRERAQPTAEVRARALALTQGLESDREKVRALYEYVSQEHRYVSLSFGIGRYQPHAAAEVLENKYGDCKDKHTLLAALLQAVGIRAAPVLIHSTRKLDETLPSPTQFDHLISAVYVGEEMLLLDTTPGLAPFGLLTTNLRDKQALLVEAEGARLIETAPHPPFAQFEELDVEGEVDALGKLTARVRLSARGDAELIFRQAMQQVPRAQWKQLGNLVAASLGISGETENFRAADPLDTSAPYWVEYEVTKNNFLDWSSRRSQLAPPLPSITLPVADADDEEHPEPFPLGSGVNSRMRVRLELPPGFTVRPPAPVAVKRDYGEYRSSYAVEGRAVTVERHLRVDERELPPQRVRDYIAFRRAVTGDAGQRFSLERAAAAAKPVIPEAAKADDLNEAGRVALSAGSYDAAVALLKRAVELEPRHKYAWNNLGRAYLSLNNFEEAIAALQKQIEVNPFDEYAYNNLGLAYWRSQQHEKAAEAFRKQVEVHPLDRWAHSNLGSLLLERKQYSQAAEALERAVAVTPNEAGVLANLGRAYLNLEQPEKALEAFEQAVNLQPSPVIWNNVAYELAVHNMHLDRARRYAESAVGAFAAQLRMLNLEHVREPQLAQVAGISAFWDTLGWVHFRLGDLDLAERYIHAAWLLGESGECGDHLGQIYEERGQRERAIRAYAMAMTAPRPYIGTRARLGRLVGEKEVDKVVEQHRAALSEQRTVRLKAKARQSSSADFFLLFAPRPDGSAEVEDVRFLSGDEDLRSLGDELRGLEYPVRFPDETQLKLARRGTLSCSPPSGCAFVLIPPELTRPE